jgi:mannosyltransferase OCH1-like enzyme
MSYRIYDGTRLELEMPVNHEVRYYIVGPDKSTDNNDDPNDDDITTSVDQVRPTQVQVWAYGRGHGELVVATNDIIKEVTVYDITGRIIARQALDLYYNTTSLTVPAGVCVVEATMRDNTKQYTQAIVK